MSKLSWLAVAPSVLFLGACAYQAPVVATPDLNVYSSYSNKLPGSYLLYIDDDVFNQNIHATGYVCSAHNYPLDARAAFKEATVKTVEQLVDHVELVANPVPSEQLVAQGKAGMIIVKGNDIQARFVMVPGFWTSSAEANVDLTAAVSVDGPTGRLFGSEGSGSGHAEAPAGTMCGGAAEALADATGKAMKQLLGQLGERMSNAPRLRGGASTAQ